MQAKCVRFVEGPDHCKLGGSSRPIDDGWRYAVRMDAGDDQSPAPPVVARRLVRLVLTASRVAAWLALGFVGASYWFALRSPGFLPCVCAGGALIVLAIWLDDKCDRIVAGGRR